VSPGNSTGKARRSVRSLGWLSAAWLAASLSSCGPAGSPTVDKTPVQAEITPEDVLPQVEEVLEFTLHERHLSIEQHAAWQILHGVLAFGAEFQVEHNGAPVAVVDYLLDGGTAKGWELEVVAEGQTGQRGVRTLMDPGSQTGQGHADQWLAYLSEAGVGLDRTIRVGSDLLTIQDWVRQIQLDVPRNVTREYSWTLVALTSLLPTDATWTAADDATWSIARLVEIEAGQELSTSACGGTHRLVGLTRALTRHRAHGGEVTGSWAMAADVIARAIEDARRYQNADGSFSTRYFESAGSSPDVAQNLGSTGHIVEFLALALDDQQLRAAWVTRAVQHLCELFRMTRDMPVECGALYHAAHGLVAYRQRLGASAGEASTAPAATADALP
jgi:hypothetical protein